MCYKVSNLEHFVALLFLIIIIEIKSSIALQLPPTIACRCCISPFFFSFSCYSLSSSSSSSCCLSGMQLPILAQRIIWQRSNVA